MAAGRQFEFHNFFMNRYVDLHQILFADSSHHGPDRDNQKLNLRKSCSLNFEIYKKSSRGIDA